MRKKSGFTIVEQAIVLVPEFEKVVHKLEQQVTLRGQSESTLKNYIRRIALFVVHFEKLPEDIDPEEINEYLVSLARDPKSPSRSSFKHMVYGLRGQEVINLKISDIDFERKTIHIRQSKYKKDRIVPLADSMAVGLKKYLTAENPHICLFNGKEADGRYSVRGLSWVMRENLKKTTITKDVSLHALRHSYATHLLEQGLNIVTLKELLGHAVITTTMIYLHVAQCP
ncbi:MAG: tyrosine-type recombinase/integrase, partial [Bacteroidetes bacterium]|nr:tyrosine-type recombinase/integrase [Bacteroidota bacterium]